MPNKEGQNIRILIPIHNGGDFPGGFDYTNEYHDFVETGKVSGNPENKIEVIKKQENIFHKRVNLVPIDY